MYSALSTLNVHLMLHKLNPINISIFATTFVKKPFYIRLLNDKSVGGGWQVAAVKTEGGGLF